MTVRVLAVVDSESFLKWAAAILAQIRRDGIHAEGRVVIIKGPLEPSAAQVDASLDGSGVASAPVVSRRDLARIVATFRPDVVNVAATGPVAEMIALTILKAAGRDRPGFLSGPPGMAYSAASTTGVKWRARWVDGYIVHSPREATLHGAALARRGAQARTIITRLPFLGTPPDDAKIPVERVVFAPQSTAPHLREDRVRILEGLARIHDAGFEVVVKLRTRPGEQQTHYEALPFASLWHQEHARLGFAVDALRFEAGPLRAWLTPGTALVTVSSTAALESLALGLPTAVIADFGVVEGFANSVYEDSGCWATLEDLPARLRDGSLLGDADWMAANYLHQVPSQLGPSVAELVEARRAGALRSLDGLRPRSTAISVYSKVKSDVPAVWALAKAVRAVLGRFRPLA